MLLLACALALVVSLGMISEIALLQADVDAATPPTTGPHPGRAPSAGAGVQAPLASSPPSARDPLLAIHQTDRFPLEALAPLQTPLANTQIVSYYGNPYTARMGILGTGAPSAVATQLEAHAATYDKLNGPIDVVPALHLVYAVAQPHPTDNGLYLQYTDDAIVQRYIELAEERGMLLFLDLQIGRSSVAEELERVLPFLRYPQVHLALDPEFAMGPGETPGVALGELRAADINWAQAVLQDLVETERLPPKLLIVHQFADSMLLEAETIEMYRGVELIIDMDGFGPAAIKQVKYERYAARSYAFNAAIKLFLEHDPDLMSEEEVLSLNPPPAVVIYQ